MISQPATSQEEIYCIILHVREPVERQLALSWALRGICSLETRTEKMAGTPGVLFICGGGHSGSTLLDLLLGEHPSITSVGEVSTLNDYIELPERICSCMRLTRDCPFWQRALSSFDVPTVTGVDDPAARTVSISKTHPLDMRRVHTTSLSLKLQYLSSGAYFAAGCADNRDNAILRRISPSVMSRMDDVHRLFDGIREQSGSSIVVDSSKHVYRFRLLRASRPESVRCIFLVRDGRARTFSDMRSEGLDAASAARKWLRVNLKTRSMIAPIPASHRLALTYEELCREPETTLRKVCSFTGLDYNDGMLSMQFDDMHNIGGNRSRFGGISEIREDTRWREHMQAADLATFEGIGGQLNRQLLGQHYRQ